MLLLLVLSGWLVSSPTAKITRSSVPWRLTTGEGGVSSSVFSREVAFVDATALVDVSITLVVLMPLNNDVGEGRVERE